MSLARTGSALCEGELVGTVESDGSRDGACDGFDEVDGCRLLLG